MTNSKALIYQNANTYRLHADNLRWSLLGGFAAFLVAVFSLSSSQTIKLDSIFINLLGFIICFAYLWIIAVQNWFYNLFARFVDDCEVRLLQDIDFQTLQSFAKNKGKEITPFHPAFFMAQLIVASVAYYFLCSIFNNIHLSPITEWVYSISKYSPIVIKIIGYCIYMYLLHICFKNWNRIIYKPIIERISNIYQPVDLINQNNKMHN